MERGIKRIHVTTCSGGMRHLPGPKDNRTLCGAEISEPGHWIKDRDKTDSWPICKKCIRNLPKPNTRGTVT